MDTRRDPAFDGRVLPRVYEAWASGKATVEGSFSTVHYAGNCERPIRVPQDTFGHRHITWEVRCRKCEACRTAKVRYWAACGYNQTKATAEAGQRSWFGTFTFSAQRQVELCTTARENWLLGGNSTSSTVPEWWDDPLCDYRFSLVRAEVVRELQLFWKRLRKSGHKFKYLVCIERHESGLPHAHCLLHEVDAPIRKRDLQNAWQNGFTKFVIVGGKSRKAARPEKAAYYVVKYLTKTDQSRVIASRGYKPEKREAQLPIAR